MVSADASWVGQHVLLRACINRCNCATLTRFSRPVYRFLNFLLVLCSESKVDVFFKQFEIGPLKIKAPDSAVGALDITYLDADLRLSRGDKGNIFVLIKE
jgi:PAP_fibrillin